MKKLLITLLCLCGVATAQSTTIRPPQPNYAVYGSYSRQLAVYEGTQRRLHALELEKYRRFREEVRRQNPPRTTNYIISRGGSTRIIIMERR